MPNCPPRCAARGIATPGTRSQRPARHQIGSPGNCFEPSAPPTSANAGSDFQFDSGGRSGGIRRIHPTDTPGIGQAR